MESGPKYMQAMNINDLFQKRISKFNGLNKMIFFRTIMRRIHLSFGKSLESLHFEDHKFYISRETIIGKILENIEKILVDNENITSSILYTLMSMTSFCCLHF